MADYTESLAVEKRLREANNALHKLAPQVAIARQVKEFSSDRRKNALAKYMAPLLIGGTPASTAEAQARASEGYLQRILAIAAEHKEAETAIAKWEATKATFEAARSLLSLNKELLRQIPE